jgi:hypothetical protein
MIKYIGGMQLIRYLVVLGKKNYPFLQRIWLAGSE